MYRVLGISNPRSQQLMQVQGVTYGSLIKDDCAVKKHLPASVSRLQN
ncbi:hypothetical protein PLUTE_b0152 [Pseudoalteromonas luteoviolacea DSM 6061]|nr:hypothetical protein [Pseudoalteromonas luteoviolacea DSM 6061]